MNIPISDNLRRNLGNVGWWKLAKEVKLAQGLAPADEPTLPSIIKSLSMKIAADRVNRKVINEGILAWNILND